MMIGIRNRLFKKLTPVTRLIINAIPNITNKASMASPFFFGYVCIWRSKKERRPPRKGELCRRRREYKPPEMGVYDAPAGG